MPPKQKSRHVALSAIVMLCFGLAVVIFKYHTQPGGQLYGVAGLGTGGGGGGTLMASSASGFGVVIDSSLSAAEISQQLTPGSSGRGPFDLSKYPGFCRKMRPPNVPVLTVQRMWLSGRQRNYTDEGFEPYVLVQRRFVPWYDERFKGYRKNKVVHLMHMFRLGVEFASTPHGYVVHSPHPVANSWNTTQATGFWYKLKKLYSDSREDMAASTFVPAASFNCDSREPEKWSFYRRLRR
ncbi:hypothetical protein CHLNCDRAFT_143733 [Chlorella variabilis]|uniref:Uncharacterized protein n=1 Tax=Chlorella variabilis TaxID=554065 RepID=E1ZAC1_CHLVA|nr:hypothetical protein CHLNCDRAFT_143733 [Chlorella variabilis]EFN57237.1 hypothetical protein CHLNCDRAFT_143733 [Chlorella variabilis]|eukprot:XP_005849339.1 hypothetical protein CHLNCDRAFT_143733 [Chlorella variabilis]